MLKKWQKQLMASAGLHIIPRGGKIELCALDVDYVGLIERYFREAPIEFRLLYKTMIFFLEFLSALSIFKFKMFTKLNYQDQNRVIQKWKDNTIYTIRSLFMVFSMPYQMAFYSDYRVLDAIGYKGYKPRVRKIMS